MRTRWWGIGVLGAAGAMIMPAACDSGSASSLPTEPPPVVLPANPGGRNTGGWLYTDVNHLRNADGSLFHGRGANLQDTRGCDACTYQAPSVAEVVRRADTLIDDWHATFVRLTLESYPSSGGRLQWQTVLDDPAYLADLVTIARHFQERHVYVLVSLWSDPNFTATGLPTAATGREWTTLATAFQDNPYVLYGVANEPQANFDGSQDSVVWTAMNQAVQTLRDAEPAGGPHHVVAVQGTRGWARRLDYYTRHPITAGGGGNVVYEEHFYDPAALLVDQLMTPAATLPILVGEFGPTTKIATMTLDDCDQLMAAAEAHDVPWLAFTFHFRCPPNLLADQSSNACGVEMPLTPTDFGTRVKTRLAASW